MQYFPDSVELAVDDRLPFDRDDITDDEALAYARTLIADEDAVLQFNPNHGEHGRFSSGGGGGGGGSTAPKKPKLLRSRIALHAVAKSYNQVRAEDLHKEARRAKNSSYAHGLGAAALAARHKGGNYDSAIQHLATASSKYAHSDALSRRATQHERAAAWHGEKLKQLRASRAETR